MNRNACVILLLVIALIGLAGCSGRQEAKKAVSAPDKIQGMAQEMRTETTPTDAAMNAGGPSMYLWEGARRYRLFLRTPFEMTGGKDYIAEGVWAQRVIDEAGDPDQGKNGYPLESSCRQAVTLAWPGLAFDVTDGLVTAVCARVKRYPARPLFLVTRITPAPPKTAEEEAAAKKKAAEDAEIKEVSVPTDKQRALLTEGSAVQTAPLWEPAGRTVRCPVLIDTEGKIAELETGIQLCEAVPWEKFRYKPTVEGGRPVKVRTEVEVRFDPRK